MSNRVKTSFTAAPKPQKDYTKEHLTIRSRPEAQAKLELLQKTINDNFARSAHFNTMWLNHLWFMSVAVVCNYAYVLLRMFLTLHCDVHLGGYDTILPAIVDLVNRGFDSDKALLTIMVLNYDGIGMTLTLVISYLLNDGAQLLKSKSLLRLPFITSAILSIAQLLMFTFDLIDERRNTILLKAKYSPDLIATLSEQTQPSITDSDLPALVLYWGLVILAVEWMRGNTRRAYTAAIDASALVEGTKICDNLKRE